MEQKIQQLSANEKEWIETQLQGARKLVEIFVPDAAAGALTLRILDQAFAAWVGSDERDNDVVNSVINWVGIAFGKALVDGLGLKWVIATDNQGSDLAVYGLPGKGDVLIYPANFVAKRWERRETDFLTKSYNDIAAQVNKLRGGGGQVFN